MLFGWNDKRVGGCFEFLFKVGWGWGSVNGLDGLCWVLDGWELCWVLNNSCLVGCVVWVEGVVGEKFFLVWSSGL